MRLGLEMSPIIVACALAVLALMAMDAVADDAENGTASGWTITNDTTLRDTDVLVNGSIDIGDADVRLYNVTLTVRKGPEPYTEIVAATGGSFEAHDCEIVFDLDFIWIEFHCDARLVRTNLSGLGHMVFMDGSGLVDRCTLTDLDAVSWGADLFVRNSTFLGKAGAGGGMDDMGKTFSIDLRIEDCTFSGPASYKHGITYTGTGLGGPDSSFLARNCTIENRYWGLQLYQVRENSTAVVENVTVRDCTKGVCFWDAGGTVSVMGLHIEAEEGFNITDCSGMHIRDVQVNGTLYGMRVFGADGELSMSDVDIFGWPCGLMVRGMEVNVVNSTIGSAFQTMVVWGEVELVDCQHGVVCDVTGEGSFVRSSVTMTLSHVGWREGPAMTEHNVSFVDETGFHLGSTAPAPGKSTFIVRYYADPTGTRTSGNARGVVSLDGWNFTTPYFTPETGDLLDLKFVDDWAPRITVDGPGPGAILDDGTVVVSGSADERGAGLAAARARYGGGPWQDVPLGDDGSFLFNLSLPDGNRSIEVAATDLVGNVGSGIVKHLLVDTVAPFIEVLSPGPRINQRAFTFVARTEVGSTVFVDLQKVQVDPDGTFSVDMEKGEGIHPVAVRAVDRAGNENSTTYSIEIDLTPPLVSVYSPTPGSWIASRSFVVSGVTEASAQVTVNDIEADRQGAEFSTTIDASDGPYHIWVDVVDVAGNSRRLEFQVVVDTRPPELLVSHPEDGLLTREPVMEVEGIVREDGQLALWVNGKVTLPDQGTWSQVVTLQEGRNEIRVRAEDGAGHVTSVTRNVTLDTTPPGFTAALVVGDQVFDPLPEAITIARDRANLSLGLSEDCQVTVQGVGTFQASEGTISVQVLLLVGHENPIVVNAIDGAGNEAGARTYLVTVDRTPPDISISEPLDRSVLDQAEVVVRGKTEPGAYLTVDGTIVPVGDNGTFTLTLSLVEGSNSFLFLAEDGLGNTRDLTLELEHVPRKDVVEDEGGGGHLVPLMIAIVAGATVGTVVWSKRR